MATTMFKVALKGTQQRREPPSPVVRWCVARKCPDKGTVSGRKSSLVYSCANGREGVEGVYCPDSGGIGGDQG